MSYMFIVGAIALLGGIVQGVTGFGAGIVMMMVLPYFFLIPQAAGVSSTIGTLLCGLMAYRYRKYVNLKKAITPSILFLCASSLSAYFAVHVNQILIKKIFGMFLLILSIYFIFFSSKEKKPMNIISSLLCIILSGISDGLFGIGGPLMVLYFLNQTTDTQEYLGTIQTFFLVNSIYMFIFRLINGIIGLEHILPIAFGMIGIATGLYFANKIVDQIEGQVIKKLTYFMIGVSGIINLL